MAASRVKADTIPGELNRCSERIQEQLEQLHKILSVITDHLGSMDNMMKKYDPDLVAQIRKLNNAIGLYKDKSNIIYGDLSNGLSKYAAELLKNLTNLTSHVSSVADAINSL